ncbi:MAG: DUF2141 domain-containing protein [Endomicrobiales bacterium]|nr:DUF2141 domain-containing protein [Endomicrobiales bacterium]
MVLFGPTVCAQDGKGDLTVNVSGLRSDSGFVLASLYDSPEGFPDEGEKAYRVARSTITGSSVKVFFSGIPYGTYAVSVVHDENANMEMDANWLGIPKEGVGASNNPKTRFGPPSYRSASLKLEKKSISLDVKVSYIGKNNLKKGQE